MSAAGPPQGAKGSPSGGSAAASAASVGVQYATHPVGVVGIGLVGLAIVERLRAARIKVLGYDADPMRCEALREAHGVVATSASEVFGACDNVVLALPDGGQTASVVRAGLPLMRPGTLVLDCGAGEPEQAVALAVRLAARGIRALDAPLSGSSQQIREGTAVMMIGGDREACDALEPILAAISSRRFLLGPPGSGARARLATHLLLGLNRAALAEALVFAESQKLDLPTFLDLVRATPAYSRAVDDKGGMMIDGEFAPPQSRVRQHRKDVGLMLAAASGKSLPLTTLHAALLDAAIADGAGDLDIAAIIDTLRRWRPPSTT
jgi:3-hydroxyisobutyrate dehydrogenase-like beta-hydroxyacid dehydrogenase